MAKNTFQTWLGDNNTRYSEIKDSGYNEDKYFKVLDSASDKKRDRSIKEVNKIIDSRIRKEKRSSISSVVTIDLYTDYKNNIKSIYDNSNDLMNRVVLSDASGPTSIVDKNLLGDIAELFLTGKTDIDHLNTLRISEFLPMFYRETAKKAFEVSLKSYFEEGDEQTIEENKKYVYYTMLNNASVYPELIEKEYGIIALKNGDERNLYQIQEDGSRKKIDVNEIVEILCTKLLNDGVMSNGRELDWLPSELKALYKETFIETANSGVKPVINTWADVEKILKGETRKYHEAQWDRDKKVREENIQRNKAHFDNIEQYKKERLDLYNHNSDLRSELNEQHKIVLQELFVNMFSVDPSKEGDLTSQIVDILGKKTGQIVIDAIATVVAEPDKTENIVGYFIENLIVVGKTKSREIQEKIVSIVREFGISLEYHKEKDGTLKPIVSSEALEKGFYYNLFSKDPRFIEILGKHSRIDVIKNELNENNNKINLIDENILNEEKEIIKNSTIYRDKIQGTYFNFSAGILGKIFYQSGLEFNDNIHQLIFFSDKYSKEEREAVWKEWGLDFDAISAEYYKKFDKTERIYDIDPMRPVIALDAINNIANVLGKKVLLPLDNEIVDIEKLIISGEDLSKPLTATLNKVLSTQYENEIDRINAIRQIFIDENDYSRAIAQSKLNELHTARENSIDVLSMMIEKEILKFYDNEYIGPNSTTLNEDRLKIMYKQMGIEGENPREYIKCLLETANISTASELHSYINGMTGEKVGYREHVLRAVWGNILTDPENADKIDGFINTYEYGKEGEKPAFYAEIYRDKDGNIAYTIRDAEEQEKHDAMKKDLAMVVLGGDTKVLTDKVYTQDEIGSMERLGNNFVNFHIVPQSDGTFKVENVTIVESVSDEEVNKWINTNIIPGMSDSEIVELNTSSKSLGRPFVLQKSEDGTFSVLSVETDENVISNSNVNVNNNGTKVSYSTKILESGDEVIISDLVEEDETITSDTTGVVTSGSGDALDVTETPEIKALTKEEYENEVKAKGAHAVVNLVGGPDSEHTYYLILPKEIADKVGDNNEFVSNIYADYNYILEKEGIEKANEKYREMFKDDPETGEKGEIATRRDDSITLISGALEVAYNNAPDEVKERMIETALVMYSEAILHPDDKLNGDMRNKVIANVFGDDKAIINEIKISSLDGDAEVEIINREKLEAKLAEKGKDIGLFAINVLSTIGKNHNEILLREKAIEKKEKKVLEESEEKNLFEESVSGGEDKNPSTAWRYTPTYIPGSYTNEREAIKKAYEWYLSMSKKWAAHWAKVDKEVMKYNRQSIVGKSLIAYRSILLSDKSELNTLNYEELASGETMFNLLKNDFTDETIMNTIATPENHEDFNNPKLRDILIKYHPNGADFYLNLANKGYITLSEAEKKALETKKEVNSRLAAINPKKEDGADKTPAELEKERKEIYMEYYGKEGNLTFDEMVAIEQAKLVEKPVVVEEPVIDEYEEGDETLTGKKEPIVVEDFIYSPYEDKYNDMTKEALRANSKFYLDKDQMSLLIVGINTCENIDELVEFLNENGMSLANDTNLIDALTKPDVMNVITTCSSGGAKFYLNNSDRLRLTSGGAPLYGKENTMKALKVQVEINKELFKIGQENEGKSPEEIKALQEAKVQEMLGSRDDDKIKTVKDISENINNLPDSTKEAVGIPASPTSGGGGKDGK